MQMFLYIVFSLPPCLKRIKVCLQLYMEMSFYKELCETIVSDERRGQPLQCGAKHGHSGQNEKQDLLPEKL